jgi:manganese/iron transport system ATP-binding protein
MVTDTNGFPAIEVEHLTVSFGPKPALLDVSLKIEPSLLVGIIGPNGAGKSTLVKAILGFALTSRRGVLSTGITP